jgi:hypothetical protein
VGVIALGLPVPLLYAVFDPPVGWLPTGEILSDREAWERFFEAGLPAEFVVKLAEGVYGQGVNVFRRTTGGFVDTLGVVRTAFMLYEALRTDGHYRKFVIQARLRTHVDLERLSGTTALQSVRFITAVWPEGDVDIRGTVRVEDALVLREARPLPGVDPLLPLQEPVLGDTARQRLDRYLGIEEPVPKSLPKRKPPADAQAKGSKRHHPVGRVISVRSLAKVTGEPDQSARKGSEVSPAIDGQMTASSF